MTTEPKPQSKLTLFQIRFAMNTSRRHFLSLASLASAALTLPRRLNTAITPPRVVVLGGGFGGATTAKYLRLWGGNINVTLVDRLPLHYSCSLSILVVTGSLPLSRIQLGYGNLQSRHGVHFLQGEGISVDPAAKQVVVQVGTNLQTLEYDKLVLSPGIDFIPPAGNYLPDLTPHAWRAGPQTLLLKKQLAAMRRKGVYILTIPKSPYRCPPGPYERVCAIADYLIRRKTGSKIIVLDANPSIQAEPANFGYAFNQLYHKHLTYIPNAVVLEVDSVAKRVVTTQGAFRGSLLNLIPDQQAGQIVRDAGLANDLSGRWAVVNPLSYASTAEPDIHVLGDAQATGQPKSGHMANAQAKVCADAIIRAFNGEEPDPNPVTSSACFSPITAKTASWLTASFQFNPERKAMQRVDASFAEAPRASSDGLQQMYQWAGNIFADSFK